MNSIGKQFMEQTKYQYLGESDQDQDYLVELREVLRTKCLSRIAQSHLFGRRWRIE